MKKLNLDDTWKYCMRMWRWIAERVKAGDERNVEQLKDAWLKKEGFGIDEIEADCFFCERDKRNITCRCCPPALIDKEFRCENTDYHFRDEPIKFYKQLRKLNRLRKLGRKL